MNQLQMNASLRILGKVNRWQRTREFVESQHQRQECDEDDREEAIERRQIMEARFEKRRKSTIPKNERKKRRKDENAKIGERTLAPREMRLTMGGIFGRAKASSDWKSDQHSEYSNEKHGQQKKSNRLLDDYYLQNPQALANGWLAEYHRRGVNQIQEQTHYQQRQQKDQEQAKLDQLIQACEEAGETLPTHDSIPSVKRKPKHDAQPNRNQSKRASLRIQLDDRRPLSSDGLLRAVLAELDHDSVERKVLEEIVVSPRCPNRPASKRLRLSMDFDLA